MAVRCLSHLECSRTGARYEADLPQGVSRAGAPLLCRYDLEGIRRALRREDWAARPPGVWRYRELLPAREPERAVTLGEGGTPLLRAERLGAALGLAHLFIKDEGKNPTGSFKDRGATVAFTRCRELGIGRVFLQSTGNAGSAAAAYGARAGIETHVLLPADAQEGAIKGCLAHGARLYLYRGPVNDLGRVGREAAERAGLFLLDTMREPYRVEGKKTLAFEVWEQMGWDLPDAIVYPTGGGVGLIAIWKALGELRALGWLGERGPRLVSVQYEGCAPLVGAFREGREECEAWGEVDILPGGMRAAKPFADWLALRALRASGGTALAVSKAETLEAMRLAHREEGIFVSPEGATTLVAAGRLRREGFLKSSERVVCFNTASGLKYLSLIAHGGARSVRPGEALSPSEPARGGHPPGRWTDSGSVDRLRVGGPTPVSVDRTKALVLGAEGQLGHELVRLGGPNPVVALGHGELELTDPGQLRSAFERHRPELVINAAAFNRVDACEGEVERTFAVNAFAVRELSLLCREFGAALVHVSTNYVFDGSKGEPYREEDLPAPLSVYGASKLAGEHFARAICERHYVVRTSAVFGLASRPEKRRNFVETMLGQARAGGPIRVVGDQVVAFTYAPDLARAIWALVGGAPYGLYHAAGEGSASWFEFARTIFELSGLRPKLEETTTAAFGAPAPRPPYSVLSTEKLVRVGAPPPGRWTDSGSVDRLRHYRETLAEYLAERG